MNRSTAARLIAVLLLTLATAACGTDGEAPGDEDIEAATTPETGEVIASATHRCDEVFEDAELDLDDDEIRQSEPAEVFDAVPAFRHLSSALDASDGGLELSEDEVTMFAPLSEAFHAASGDDGDDTTAGTDTGDEAEDYTQLPAESVLAAHLHEGGSLSSMELIDAGTLEMADGSQVAIDWDDELLLERDGAAVRVVCSDVEVAGATIHVIDGLLFDAGELGTDAQEPDDDRDGPERDGIRQDLDEQLDEQLEGDDGTGTPGSGTDGTGTGDAGTQDTGTDDAGTGG